MPIANAVSVQAASATPRRSKSVGYSGPLLSPAPKIGWTYQETSPLNAPAASVITTASGTSWAMVHRERPKPWVHAYRKVPVSSSLASSGAPVNAPISAGIT